MATENHGYKLRIIAIICYVAAFVGVALRFYVRKFVVGKLALDDWLMAVAMALYTMYISFVFVGLHYGTGQHHRDLPNHNIVMAVRYWYFCEWAYVLTTTIIKYAVGVFYLRIMIQRWQVLVVKFVMWAVVIFGIAYFGCVVAQCVPAPFIWMRYQVPMTYQGSCLPDPVILWGTYLHSILSASGDWTLGLLPIALLWNAKMGRGTKAMMCLVLGLGAIASTSTLVRLSVIHTIIDLDDFLWDTLGIAIWSTVEPGVALLAAGLATIRPLLRSLFPALFSSAMNLEIPSVSSISALESCSHPTETMIETTDSSQPPTLPHIHPTRSPPPVPFSPTSLHSQFPPLSAHPPFPYSSPPVPEVLLASDNTSPRLAGFGAGMGSAASFPYSPPTIPGVPLASNNASPQLQGFGAGVGPSEAKGKGKGRVMSVGIGSVGRKKSWRSITTAKTEDSSRTSDGYGNITIVYAEASKSSKAREVLGGDPEEPGG
ncbi:hypothetical protein BDZ45DRAFT_657965 [Acephala macrosclerotiorum]|nr:hypothetical protein BDZ45DRAFT_657965 [Acephala macrosclerotiorum]